MSPLRALLGPGVAVCERSFDPPDVPLYPQERAAVAGAVASRRREFATVRLCAREAMAELGLAPGPIPPGERREPCWPDGVVGSLTHCDGFRAAAVARSDAVAALGIDAEPDLPLPDGVEELITLAPERVMLRALERSHPGPCWPRLLFSAKESIYKAWYPLTGRWLGFEECRLTLEPGGRFTGLLGVPGPVLAGRRLDRFEGRWAVGAGGGPEMLLTAVRVAAA